MKSKRLIIILAIVIALLLIPLITMQFTDEVKWTGFDFIVMGGLLLGMGSIIEIVLRTVTKRQYRIALCLAVVGVFLLVWVELAVGIFGTPFAGS